MTWLRGVVLAGTALAIATVATPALAQTSLQIPLQFDFLNSGAKSLALAGSFVGLADDASAAFANPAGLTQLARTEVSMELRGFRRESTVLERGRLSGGITNQGVDTVAGPRFANSAASHLGPGFLSVVYVPGRAAISADSTELPQRSWALAAYRHEFVRVDQRFLSQGVFQRDPTELTSRRDEPQEGVRQVSMTAYGVSAAWRLRSDLSVGAGVTLYEFDLESVFRRFLPADGFFGPPNFAMETGRATQSGHGVGLAPNVGVLWTRGPTRVGALYRHGASFDITTVAGTEQARSGQFRVPHRLALGASRQIRPSVLVAAEVTRIAYRRLRESFVTDQARFSGREASFTIDSGTEVHGGLQIARPWRFRPRFRAGAWFDPDHSVRFTPSEMSETPLDRLFDERLAAALSSGTREVHGTAGVGLTLTPRLDLHAGIDISSTGRVFSTSVIVK